MLSDSDQFSRECYDILVIGGGINGAAIANIASENGHKVALIEKGDFASGTSSKSTKLIHGGLRYLEHLEFDLVREALKERYLQLKAAPHLVKPLCFILPVYESDPRPLWMMKFGVSFYDFLSGKYLIKRHRSLTPQEICELSPGIKKDGLQGGVMFYDAQMDDARLCLENILSAKAKGAHLANYVEAQKFIKENGKVVGCFARDILTQSSIEIRAKFTVCASGPWSNKFLLSDNPYSKKKIRLTKGTHIVYRQQITRQALLLQTQKDHRIFFIIPWMGHSLIGTTDTDYSGSPDRVEATDEDINYLLQEARRIFPAHSFLKGDIVTTFAGLRPLVYQKGLPSRVSRKHVFERSYSGVLYVLGGKYTTYRKIAEECLTLLLNRKLRSSNSDYPLFGSGEIKESSEAIAKEFGADLETVEYLISKYGSRYRDILNLTKKDPSWKNKICTCTPAILAQIVYSKEVEMAKTPEDIIWRRLGIGYVDCQTKKCRDLIQKLFL